MAILAFMAILLLLLFSASALFRRRFLGRLFGSGFFGCAFFVGCSFGFGCRLLFGGSGFAFLGSRSSLLLGLRQLRCGKALAVKSDLSDADLRKRLAMAVNLFVLLLAFEVEDQDLVCASGFRHLPGHHHVSSRPDLAFLARS